MSQEALMWAFTTQEQSLGDPDRSYVTPCTDKAIRQIIGSKALGNESKASWNNRNINRNFKCNGEACQIESV